MKLFLSLRPNYLRFRSQRRLSFAILVLEIAVRIDRCGSDKHVLRFWTVSSTSSPTLTFDALGTRSAKQLVVETMSLPIVSFQLDFNDPPWHTLVLSPCSQLRHKGLSVCCSYILSQNFFHLRTLFGIFGRSLQHTSLPCFGRFLQALHGSVPKISSRSSRLRKKNLNEAKKVRWHVR